MRLPAQGDAVAVDDGPGVDLCANVLFPERPQLLQEGAEVRCPAVALASSCVVDVQPDVGVDDPWREGVVAARRRDCRVPEPAECPSPAEREGLAPGFLVQDLVGHPRGGSEQLPAEVQLHQLGWGAGWAVAALDGVAVAGRQPLERPRDAPVLAAGERQRVEEPLSKFERLAQLWVTRHVAGEPT